MIVNQRLLVCLAVVAITGMATLIVDICRWSLSDGENEAESSSRAVRYLGDTSGAESGVGVCPKVGRSCPSGTKTCKKPFLAALYDDEGDDRTPLERELEEHIEKAKDTYEFVTGDEWVGAKEAARQISEECEQPEAS